jgi:hypothetical protein
VIARRARSGPRSRSPGYECLLGLGLGLVVGLWPWSLGGAGWVGVGAAGVARDTAGGPPGVPPSDIGGFEGRVTARLRATQPRTEALAGRVRFRLRRVVWNERGGRPFFRAAEVNAVADGAALGRGDVVVEELRLSSPEIRLERRRGETAWNWQRILATEGGGGVGGRATRPRLVLLRDIAIERGRAEVRSAETTLVFQGIQARLPRVALSGPDIPYPEVVVGTLRATTTLDHPAIDPTFQLGLNEGIFRFPGDRVTFEVRRLTLDQSLFTGAQGLWRFGRPGIAGLEGRIRGERVRFADVRFLAPVLPTEGVASFELNVAPLAGNRTELQFRALAARTDGSAIRGALGLEVGGGRPVELRSLDVTLDPLTVATLERSTGPLPYDGELRGRVSGSAGALDFAVVASLTAPEVGPFDLRLTGRAALADEGLALRSLVVEFQDLPLVALRPITPGIPLRGVATGRVAMEGAPSEVPIRLDVRLTLAPTGGEAAVAGTLDLTGPVVAYDLSGQLSGVQLDSVLAVDVPPVAIDARFGVVGRGLALPEASARLDLEGRFTGWEAAPGDTLVVRLALSEGLLTVETASIRLATLELEGAGVWALEPPSRGALRYRLAIGSLEPWGPYLPFLPDAETSGSIRTEGTLAGTLDQPQFEGAAEGEELVYGGWAVSDAEARYALTLGGPTPVVVLDLFAHGIDAPGAGTYDTASVRFRLTPPVFALDLRADRVGDGLIEVLADGRVQDGRGEGAIRRMNIDLDGQRWTLARPAGIRWGDGEAVAIQGFVLREEGGEGRVAIDGRLPPTAGGLRVEVVALPIDAVLGALGREADATGDLTATIEVTGTGENPQIQAEFDLENVTVREVRFTGVRGELQYTGRQLSARAMATVDTLAGATLELRASVPLSLTLDLPPRASLIDTGPVEASLEAEAVPLVVLESFTTQVEDAEGTLDARVVLSGTPADPRLEGSLTVQNGALTVPAMNQRYREITADLVLEGGTVEVRELRARSDGWAQVTGTIVFEELTRPVADLTISFDRFRAMGVEDRQGAAVWGELQVLGPLSEPTVTGRLELDDGWIAIPALARRGFEGDTIDGVELEPLPGEEPAPPEGGPWLGGVNAEIVVEAGDNLWFTTEEAEAQLAGEVVINVTDGELRITGVLEGERGTLTFRAGPIVRRFDIVRAQIRFLGEPDPNPELDITASRIVIDPVGRELEILAQLGGTLREPTLSLSTPGGVPIPESELLSYLLFGQPSFALTEGILPGEAVLETTLSELATIELEEALAGTLGLDIVQVRSGAAAGPFGPLGIRTLVIGREVAEDVFLTVESGLATLFGPGDASVTNPWAVRLEWRIRPGSTLRVGYEPVDRGRLFRGLVSGLPVVRPEQQFTVDYRLRWTY